MTFIVAIAGLAFLILIHEAGHFFVALAVGMRPRRFYVGFPPALAKTTRGGVEYGLGAIPLGGYVKIPGMHRPAPSDLDVHFGAALQEEPRLLGVIDRMKRVLDESDFEPSKVCPHCARCLCRCPSYTDPRLWKPAPAGFRRRGFQRLFVLYV